jgi:hypothetical protein
VETQQVSSLINCLTNNEDERQDLWVHYLSGNSERSFASKLQELQQVNEDDLKIKEALLTLYKAQSNEKLTAIFSTFSDFERHIVFLLLIDFSPDQISSYKGISEVRIRQAIQAIRYNKSLCTLKKHARPVKKKKK